MRSVILGVGIFFLAIKVFGGALGVHETFPVPPLAAVVIVSGLLAYFLRVGRPVTGPVSIPLADTERLGLLVLFGIIVAWGIWLRVRWIGAAPIDVKQADMLPTVLSQIRDFFSGSDPYAPLPPGPDGRALPRFYLPGLWLAYAPFVGLGLDMRLLNILAHLVLYLLLLDCFLHKGSYAGVTAKWSAVLFIVPVALHAFSKQAIGDVGGVQTGPFWLSYSIFLWAALRGRPVVAAVMIPWVVLCRHLSFLLVLPYAVWLFRQDRAELRRTLLLSTGIGVVLAIPILLSARNLLDALLFYGVSASQESLERMIRYYSLPGLLAYLGISWLQKPLQIAGTLFFVTLGFLNRSPLLPVALAIGGCAYLWAIFLMGTGFAYLYWEPLILLLFLLNAPVRAGELTAG